MEVIKKFEIDILDEATALKQIWQYRDQRMLSNRDMVNLVLPEQDTSNEPGKIRWMSNEPKVFFETAKALVSSYPPKYRMPLTVNYEEDEKQRISKAERLIIGIFRQLDRRLQDIGDPNAYWLRGLAHWVLSGWYAIFTHIRKGQDGVDFIADLWDPITVYPRWDDFGLQKVARVYEVEKKQAEIMAESWKASGLNFDYKEPSYDSKVQITNYWLRIFSKDKKGKMHPEVFNAITMGGSKADLTVVKELEKEDFKHIPIFVGGIGSPEKTSADWSTRFGEHIITANRELYQYTNQLISLMAVIMAETAYPNLISKTKTGQRVTKDGMKGYGSEYALKVNEAVELLKHAASPPELQALIAYLGSQKQKGSLPDVVYGGLPQTEISGFGISQLMAAIKYKIAPYLQKMQLLVGGLATEFLEQYRDGKYPSIKLTTHNPHELRKGQFFVEEFSRSDVPDVTFVEVIIPVTSAMDRTQQIIFARQALEPPQILSRETLWDDILEIQDSEQEYARIIQDEMLELPIVKTIGIIEQLRRREKLYRENGKIAEADALHQYIMMMEMGAGLRQGIPQKGQGIPPNVMPPEAINSPDMMNAALGQGPPGINRPSKGIFGPNGQML